ncbi:LEAF RUST 10 DISEASE-RESISTANCE LOCUS RECEPTOR-LIKE PROTEIN KINASE-like 1.4 [Sesamum alatum]|uniref:non-specific serine/threonine protein kinase n=1 Tax=Sesamum alatum TaxID=300844 RepID=A0AAE1XR71_9LAMI|nr:LEAF RUST 10 DISEASE-RESISTANCE LOCUS RECEPTOR-LIKE PROTEIN KINASE-like 1.4 [Sesamum alatum]
MPSSLLLITFTAALLTAAYSQPTTTTYPNCNRTFSCGAITNITYPFTGGDRPAYCGLPDFALTCRNNAITELNQNSFTYRVLQLNQTQRTLVLSRSDLYNNTCPSEFHNSTLNSTLFSYDGPLNEALTLFYGCNTSGMTVRPYNLFPCNSTGLNFTDAYFLIGPVPRDPILRIVSCSMSVSVPVLRTAGNQLTNSRLSLGEALMQGFAVNYSDPYQRLCSECSRLGGQCGFDSVLGQPVCICGDRPCPFSLTLPPEGSPNATEPLLGNNSNLGRNIGLPIGGAVLAGVGLGWLIFYCRQRRKQRLAAQSSRAVSKEFATEASSKPLSTPPSTHFVKSIPSYPSSNSDLGRDSTYYGVQVFSYTELEEATDNFSASRELGDGGFGAVYYGVLPDGRIVAVKRLHRHDINLANMAINKIQNHTLHELVDSSLGFETNSTVRRMATLVAELAFRCLQQERDMRPSMAEVLEALRGIQNEDLNAHKVEIVDILVDEDTEPLKGVVTPPSPDSVSTEKWASGSAPNSSG